MTEIKGKPLAWRTIDQDRRFVGTGLGFTAEVALMHSGMWALVCAHAPSSDHLSEAVAKLRAQDIYDDLIRQWAMTDPQLEVLSARLAEVEAERDALAADGAGVFWANRARELAIHQKDLAVQAEMRAEAAEAREAKLRSDLMLTIATANGALDPTATEATLRRDLFRVREELRDILWPPPSKETPHD